MYERSNRLFEYQNHWLVKRRDTPNYHIYWCRPGTRRVRRKSANTDDFEKAKRQLIEFAHERERPRNQKPENASILDALNEYIERSLDGRPSKVHALLALSHLDRFFEREGIVFVSDLTLDVQDAYIEWRRSTGRGWKGQTLSNATIARELSVLKAALKTYWKRGLIKEIPYVKSLPPPPPRSRFLNVDEARRLIDACHEAHVRLFVLLALHTLQRPSAILNLQTRQIDLTTGRIDFLPPGAVQSHKRKPVVPITVTLRPHLERAITETSSGHVIEYHGIPVLSVKKSFKRACKRANLHDVTPYTLRHTGATLLAAAGVSMRQIAGMLGHTTQRTTELYAKHAPEFLKDASDQLDSLFQPTLSLPSSGADSQQLSETGSARHLRARAELPTLVDNP